MAKVTGATNSGLEVVATADSIGKCTEERSGEMKFATKENAILSQDSLYEKCAGETFPKN